MSELTARARVEAERLWVAHDPVSDLLYELADALDAAEAKAQRYAEALRQIRDLRACAAPKCDVVGGHNKEAAIARAALAEDGAS